MILDSPPVQRAVQWFGIFLRIVFAGVVVWKLQQGALLDAGYAAVIWLVLLVLWYVGRASTPYVFVDVLLQAFMLISMFSARLGVQMHPDIIGVDKVFHMAAGVLLALAALALYRSHIMDRRVLALTAVAFVLALGTGWEFFEWIYFKIDPRIMQVTYDDTMTDLIADMLGGILAAGAWLLLAQTRRSAKK